MKINGFGGRPGAGPILSIGIRERSEQQRAEETLPINDFATAKIYIFAIKPRFIRA